MFSQEATELEGVYEMQHSRGVTLIELLSIDQMSIQNVQRTQCRYKYAVPRTVFTQALIIDIRCGMSIF